MANETAPVCLLPNRGQQPPLQAGVLTPRLAKPTDLPSLVQVTNSLTQLITNLIRPTMSPFRNNVAPTNPNLGTGGTTQIINSGPGPAGKDGKDGKTKPVSFKESKRTKKKVKIYFVDPATHEADEDQYIIVERITALEFTDKASGSKLVWRR